MVQFLQNLARNGQSFGFSICQSGGKCFDPLEWVEKACLQGGARLNFPGAGQIYQLHRPRKAATTKRKQKDIGKYRGGEILCLKGGRGTTLRGRMRRSKQSGQSKKLNNKKLLENTPSSAVIYSRKGLEESNKDIQLQDINSLLVRLPMFWLGYNLLLLGDQLTLLGYQCVATLWPRMRTKMWTRRFARGIPILCLGGISEQARKGGGGEGGGGGGGQREFNYVSQFYCFPVSTCVINPQQHNWHKCSRQIQTIKC